MPWCQFSRHTVILNDSFSLDKKSVITVCSCGKVMFSQASVILSTGWGHVWQGGVCVAGRGVCGRGHVWQRGACMVGGHVWWRYAWQGTCMAEGVCMARGACMAVGGMCGSGGGVPTYDFAKISQ